MQLVDKHGGRHHGYFLPAEGASDKALALFSFDSLAAYEIYRQRFGVDPEFIAADRIRDDGGCVIRHERTFLRPLLPESAYGRGPGLEGDLQRHHGASIAEPTGLALWRQRRAARGLHADIETLRILRWQGEQSELFVCVARAADHNFVVLVSRAVWCRQKGRECGTDKDRQTQHSALLAVALR